MSQQHNVSSVQLTSYTLAGVISCLLLCGSVDAQSSTSAVPSTTPANVVPGGGVSLGGSGTSAGNGSGSGSSGRTRTIVSLNWYQAEPFVYPRQAQASPSSYVPRAQRQTSTTFVPVLPVSGAASGLSTAMPNWKIATSVVPTTVPSTGHTTYSPPVIVSTPTVVLPRRNYSYGISFVRTR